MATVLLIIHMLIAASLVGVVLLQRSEGGALGIGGGGGGGGGFLTGRGTANLLTRVTAGLAAAFFLTSVLLTMIAQRGDAPGSIFDTPGQPSSGASAPQAPGSGPAPADGSAPAGRGGILDKLQQTPTGPSVPQTR